jgi:hypothetical protein
MPGFFDQVRRLWQALAPDADAAQPEAVVHALDDRRTEFAWQGPALVVDRRRQVVLRGGRVLLRLAQIRSVDIVHVRADEYTPEHWRVSLSTGLFAGETIGSTPDDVDASIAAARLATVLDVKVRAL